METSQASSQRMSLVITAEGKIEDNEISTLLRAVYVDAGFTAADVAETLFAPASVRARGTLFTARDPETRTLLGMAVLVPPGGAARQIANDSEAEVHLLAVYPEARRKGVGSALVDALITRARSCGWQNIVLSTQERMHAAQTLYKHKGFIWLADRDWWRSGKRFLVFGMSL